MTERTSVQREDPFAAGRRARGPGMRHLSLLVLAAVVLAAAAVYLLPSPGSTAPVRALDPTTTPTPTILVRLEPETQTIAAGTDAVVDVWIGGVENLAAYEFTLTFDPAVLTFVDVQNGAFLGSTGRIIGFCPQESGAGSIRYGCASAGEDPGPDGGGILATVTFGTSCAGSSDLEFSLINLADPLAETPMPARTRGGSVTVTGGDICVPSTPTPTGTPPGAATPTATATPTTAACDGACPTSTPTTPAPTNTPTPTTAATSTPTSASTTPTNTPPAGSTPTPTTSPSGGPTSTPTHGSTRLGLGDANGDGEVDSVDALLILWFDARVLPFVPFWQVADANLDGIVNAVDAALVLQFDAGLLATLPSSQAGAVTALSA